MTVETWHIASYLPVGAADYNYILDIAPSNILPVSGRKRQSIFEMDDNSLAVVPISNTSVFDIELQWEHLSSANMGILLGMWHEAAKCNGSQRTFYWKHPLEDNIYVARFLSELKHTYSYQYTSGYVSVESIAIRIEAVTAYYAYEAVSVSESVTLSVT